MYQWYIVWGMTMCGLSSTGVLTADELQWFNEVFEPVDDTD